MGNSIEWIKIYTNIFENRKIKFILSLKNGEKILIIWLRLLTLAGKINDRGNVYVSTNIPYNSKSLGVEFGESAKVIEEALKIFESLDMIRVSEDAIIIESWEEYQNVEGMERVREQTRNRVKKYRDKKNVTEQCNVTESECNVTVTQQNKNKNKNKNTNNIVDAVYIESTYDEKRYNSSNIIEYWDKNIFPITPAVAEELNLLEQEFGELNVRKGLNKMVKANVKNLNYLRRAIEGIASGNDFDDKPPINKGFQGFDAIIEELCEEGTND